jgi:hypothetical protein
MHSPFEATDTSTDALLREPAPSCAVTLAW